MAWTHNPSDTLTQSTAIERWRALILMLNGRGDITTNQGGWVSGTGGRTGTERRAKEKRWPGILEAVTTMEDDIL